MLRFAVSTRRWGSELGVSTLILPSGFSGLYHRHQGISLKRLKISSQSTLAWSTVKLFAKFNFHFSFECVASQRIMYIRSVYGIEGQAAKKNFFHLNSSRREKQALCQTAKPLLRVQYCCYETLYWHSAGSISRAICQPRIEQLS